MTEKPLTVEQFQQLLEYISAQAMVAVLEHESRVHMPMNSQSKRALHKANEVRKTIIAELRVRLVRE